MLKAATNNNPKHIKETSDIVEKERKLDNAALNIRLFNAVEESDFKNTKKALDLGANVNSKDKYKGTPLHWAINNANKGIAAMLIAYGADVNAKDVFGWTPLHHAVVHSHEEIAKLLIENGASLEIEDNFGKSPLEYGSEETKGIIIQAALKKRIRA